MKVLITGGHFSPAYSLIKELGARRHEVIIAGRRYPFEGDKTESLEYAIAKEENLPFYEIKTGRFQRKFTAYTITSLLKAPIGFLTSIKILSEAKPNIVLTFCGYIGLPISLAAQFLGIPVVLHEQTQKAGLASRIVGRFSRKICVSFKSSANFFPAHKVVMTGNPVRIEIFESKGEISIPEGRVIYVTGGSTGSHFINSVIYDILEDLLRDFAIIHQTGDSLKFRDFEKLSHKKLALPQNLAKRYILKKFIYPREIGDVLRRADLIISRSGANIIFEIMATQKMSLLIPLPHGQNLEQLENAKFLKNLGVSEYVEENDAVPKKILDMVRNMFKDQERYKNNMENVREFLIKDAAQRIADVVEGVYGEKKS